MAADGRSKDGRKWTYEDGGQQPEVPVGRLSARRGGQNGGMQGHWSPAPRLRQIPGRRRRFFEQVIIYVDHGVAGNSPAGGATRRQPLGTAYRRSGPALLGPHDEQEKVIFLILLLY